MRVVILLQCHAGATDIVEVPVKWHEVEGSKLATGKLALIIASLGMLRDMICVRACYVLGIWGMEEATSTKEFNVEKKHS